MKHPNPILVSTAVAVSLAVLGVATRRPLAHAGEPARQATAAPLVSLPLPAAPPPGAIVLLAGKQEDLTANWLQRYTNGPAPGKIGNDGGVVPGKDIVTTQAFGDAYVHVEFQCPTRGGGNAGVGLQGRYEIQIENSFGQTPEAHGCGAFYSQKPASVNACRNAGEWQSYDIIFRAPRFGSDGKLTEKPRATVFQNGVLIHNNEDFLDMTGIQYSEFKEMAKTGPLILQGDHDAVAFRNVWIVPR